MKEKICGCGCGKTESVVLQDIRREFGDSYEEAKKFFDDMWQGEFTEC